MSSQCDNATNSSNSHINTIIDIPKFCRTYAPDFTPLGGSRPDAAVVGCAAVWMEDEEEAEKDVILPPDVLDTALAMLCAPLIITHVGDLRGREAHFGRHAASVRLRNTQRAVCTALQEISAETPEGGLSVTVELEESVTELGSMFLSTLATGKEHPAVGRVDLRRTSLQSIDNNFIRSCKNMTAVTLPRSLTEVKGYFLVGCDSLQCLDMRHTALLTVGDGFASSCDNLTTVVLPETVTKVGEEFLMRCNIIKRIDLGRTALHTVGRDFACACCSLTTVVLPDTVTTVGDGFLSRCGRVEVTSGSTAVQIAAVTHNSLIS